MTRFTDLVQFTPGLHGPGQAQEQARRNLPASFADSPMRFLDKPSATNDEPDRVRIGVVVWSQPDLRLLDLIAERIGRSQSLHLSVEVFDADRCASDLELQLYVPGVHLLNQSPYVGVWAGGRIRETAAGFNGRKLLARVLGMSDAELTAALKMAPQNV